MRFAWLIGFASLVGLSGCQTLGRPVAEPAVDQELAQPAPAPQLPAEPAASEPRPGFEQEPQGSRTP